MSKKDKQPEQQLSACVISWVEKLATHFNIAVDEEQYTIFVNALRSNTKYQVDIAFERCLNECEYMPKLRDVHMRMPEQRYAPENPSAFVLNGPRVIDEVREIAKELRPDYETLEGKELFDLFFRAGRLRYERMGLDMTKWPKEEEVKAIARIDQQKKILKEKGLL